MYKLRFYITGHTVETDRVIKMLRETLDYECKEPYDLCVLDIFDNIDKAYEDNILVTPTLIKKKPLPRARIFGDLSDGQRVLTHLQMCLEE